MWVLGGWLPWAPYQQRIAQPHQRRHFGASFMYFSSFYSVTDKIITYTLQFRIWTTQFTEILDQSNVSTQSGDTIGSHIAFTPFGSSLVISPLRYTIISQQSPRDNDPLHTNEAFHMIWKWVKLCTWCTPSSLYWAFTLMGNLTPRIIGRLSLSARPFRLRRSLSTRLVYQQGSGLPHYRNGSNLLTKCVYRTSTAYRTAWRLMVHPPLHHFYRPLVVSKFNTNLCSFRPFLT